MNRVIGTYITNSLSSESFRSFVPKPLPPDPPLKLSDEHYDLLDKATLALGRLDGLTSTGQLSREVVSLYKASILNNIETHITTCCNALEPVSYTHLRAHETRHDL